MPIPAPCSGRVHRHPVEIVGAQGARGGTPADPADQPAVELGAEGEIIGGSGDGAVEDLEGHRYLVGAEDADRTGDGLDPAAVGRG